MVVIPPKPWPRQMDFVERATCLLPDFDAVREVLSDEPIREATLSRITGAVDDEFDLNDAGKPFDPREAHNSRDLAIAAARAELFSARCWFIAELAVFTEDVDRIDIEDNYPVQLSAVIEGYAVYGRWRDSVYGPEYSSEGMWISPNPDDILVLHRIDSRRYASWQEFPGSAPHPQVGPEWQRIAFVALWAIRQHKASAVCDGDHGCCELCGACTIEVPDYVAAGRPQYELPADDPLQRQADIAAAEIARDEETRLSADLLTRMKATQTREERVQAREHMYDTLSAWRGLQGLLAQRTFTLVVGPAGPEWQADE